MKISVKVIYWLPRIIGIIGILFISMFALDAFAPGLTVWQQLTDFMMHLIPSFVLAAILILAWKKELAGGILFALIGLGTCPLIYLHNHNVNHFSILQCIHILLLINLPFIVVGGLFIFSHFARKRNQSGMPEKEAA